MFKPEIRQATILVADDQEAYRCLLSNLLEDKGYKVAIRRCSGREEVIGSPDARVRGTVSIPSLGIWSLHSGGQSPRAP